MRSRATPRFWAAYRDLPPEIQELARKAYRLFRENPAHPSLHFKKVHYREPVYSARVSLGYRALGLLNLPQFGRHPRSHESAVGVVYGQTETAGVHEGVQGAGVRLVRESGKPGGTVAQDLDLAESVLRHWVRQARIDSGHGPAGALTTDVREEFTRRRREVRTLRMERDILKKATAFLAKESE